MKTGELAAYYKHKYPLTFKRDVSSIDPSLPKRYEDAWEVAKIAAAILKENYGANKVVVFGSLADRSSFTLWSDIDLAVWGVPDETFYAAVGAVTSLSAEFKIDLVDVLGCHASIRKEIKIKGIEI